MTILKKKIGYFDRSGKNKQTSRCKIVVQKYLYGRSVLVAPLNNTH